MSVPNEKITRASPQLGTAGRMTADGRRIYRMVAPQIVWWTWIGMIVAGLADLGIQGHDLVSLRFALGLLAATGFVYACTLWPRLAADDKGITVRNPFRCFDIPWGAVRGIFLADSVEVQCARQAPKKDKTVYSWALSSPRRTRARAQLRGLHWDQGKRNAPSEYGRLPDSAKALAKMTTGEIMARELGRLSEEARSGSMGEAQDVLSARWAWVPLAAILVPAIALVIVALAG